jgi:hypothetical protein
MSKRVIIRTVIPKTLSRNYGISVYSIKSEDTFYTKMAEIHSKYGATTSSCDNKKKMKKKVDHVNLTEDEYLSNMAKKHMYSDPTGEYFDL